MAQLQIAPPDLRLASPRAFTQIQFATDPGEALENINTTNMPDGAMCYCTDNRALYILDKTSTDAAVLDAIVVPIAGPGRWFVALINSSGGVDLFNANAYLDNPPDTVVIADNTSIWTALAANQFVRQGTFISGLFTLNGTTGVITYNGPNQNFLCVATFSIGSSTTDATIDVAVDCAGTSQTALLGTTSSPNWSQNAFYDQASLTRISISAPRVVALRAGNTIQGVVRNIGDGDDLIVYKYSLTISRLA
jgi:hypothetical protein